MCVPLQEGATETKQLAPKQLAVNLANALWSGGDPLGRPNAVARRNQRQVRSSNQNQPTGASGHLRVTLNAEEALLQPFLS